MNKEMTNEQLKELQRLAVNLSDGPVRLIISDLLAEVRRLQEMFDHSSVIVKLQVERDALRAENERLKKTATVGEIQRLRARLAEAERLLSILSTSPYIEENVFDSMTKFLASGDKK